MKYLPLLALLTATAALATPEYSRRTDKDCSYCHPAKGWTLIEAGKYYKEHKSLKGYTPPPEDGKKPAAPATKTEPKR